MINIFFLHAWGINTLIPKPKGLDRNFVGDEMTSTSLGKYLLRNHSDFIDHIGYYLDDARNVPQNKYDIAIDMNYTLAEREKGRIKIWYCQNGYTEGSKRIFEEKSKYYDGVAIAAKKLYEEYKDWESHSGHKPLFLPLAADLEKFTIEYDPEWRFDIAYCGNDIKRHRTLPMINPCLKYNFGLFGRWSEECKRALYEISRGQISMDDLKKLYSSSKFLLNIHFQDCAEWGLWAGRIFDVMASNGIVISDDAYGLKDVFGDRIFIVQNGDELTMLLHQLLVEGDKAKEYPRTLSYPFETVNNRRWLIQQKHTWEDRTKVFVEYLKEFV